MCAREYTVENVEEFEEHFDTNPRSGDSAMFHKKQVPMGACGEDR